MQGRILIERVVSGFAAARSNQLYAGDELVAIDGVPLREMSLDAIRGLTVGEEGTVVAVEVLRGPNVLRVILRRQFPESMDDTNMEAQQIISGTQLHPKLPIGTSAGAKEPEGSLK